MDKKQYSIILADDHEIFLDSLVLLLSTSNNLKVVSTVKTGKDLVKKVIESPPDLCIVDMDMPEMNGLEASETLLKLFPELKIMILTMHNEKSLVKKMVSIGIKGYLTKTCDKDEFMFAVNQLLKFKTYFSDIVVESLSKEINIVHDASGISKVALLSEREKEIIGLLCRGMNNRQISETLFLSVKTVDNHRTNIMHKLEVHNIVELIRFSLKHGLSD